MEEQIQIGQYTLARKIGEGGMAEVWEAYHIRLGNRVAVKFLFPEFARNQELQKRFLNEGKRQAQLQHPNIVPATDFFEVEGRSYLVMQYIEGANLEARLQKDNPPLKLEEIHSISWDILSALSYAHSLDVIHRDVKPSNMLIDHSGRVLLVDFGLALALSVEQRLTRTDMSMGTPEYMSPEQITRPMEVDARTDIYSFGCVLYAMLSGDPPFGGAGVTPFYIHDCQVRKAPPPLVYLNPEVSPMVEQVVLRCLEKEPEARFQNCGEVMDALEGALSGNAVTLPRRIIPQQPPILPPKTVTHEKRPTLPKSPAPVIAEPRPSSAKKYVLAGIAAVVLIGALWLFWRSPKPVPPEQARRAALLQKDWRHVDYRDKDFDDCMDVKPCMDRKTQAEKLKAVQDWKAVPYNSAILADCMAYQPCVDRTRQAEQLQATKDWSHADKQLLGDCMGYPPCAQAKHTGKGGGNGSGDVANFPCCNDSPDPAACRAIKKREQILGDCSDPFNHT